MDKAQSNQLPYDLYRRQANLPTCTDLVLISTPARNDSQHFNSSIVYIITHDAKGAVGVVLNKPLGASLAEVIQSPSSAWAPNSMLDAPLLIGGPLMSETLWALHHTIPEQPMPLGNAQLSLARTQKELLQVDQAPNPPLAIGAGMAGWGEGQLEREIELQGWVVLPRTEELFEIAPEHRYLAMMQLVGVYMPHLVS